MFNKAFSRVLAGATVAAVCTLGVPALPALASPSAPTLAVSVDSGAGYTTLVGSSLQLDFQTKNLQGQRDIYIGLTQLTGTEGDVVAQENYGADHWVPKGDDSDTLWVTDTDYSGTNNTFDSIWLSAESAATVRVESFIDMDNSGDWTQGDIVGADQTVKFVKTEDAGLKVTLATPQDNRQIVAKLTSTNADLNLASLDADNIGSTQCYWWVDMPNYGGNNNSCNGLNWGVSSYNYPYVDIKESNFKINDGFNGFDSIDTFDWNSSTKELTGYSYYDASEDYYYQSQLWYTNWDDEEDYKIGGTASVKAGPDIEGSVSDITDVTAVSTSNVNAEDEYIEVRSGTKSVVVNGKAVDGVLGAHVLVSIYDGNSENADDTYTVDGSKLDSDPVSVAVKADGSFSFTVATEDATATDYVELWVTDFDGNNGYWADVYWNAAEPTITNTTPNFSNNSDIALLDREVYTAKLELKDQFGVFLTDGTYKLEYTATGNDDVTFVNGKASVSESFRYTVVNPRIDFTHLYKNGTEINSSDWNIDDISFDVREKNIASYDIYNTELDSYVDPSQTAIVSGATWNYNNVDDEGYIATYSDDVYGDNASYAKVTYSAPAGLAFVVRDVVYTGSVTVYSDNNGYSSVDYIGNKTGDYKITVTSGTDSYTETVHVNGSDLAPAKAVVLDSQTSELNDTNSGGNNNVWAIFKFFDKFGNPTTNHNVTGSIVGDEVTNVYENNYLDWTEGWGWNGDGEDYYERVDFNTLDTFSGTKTLKIVVGSFSYSLPLVIGDAQILVSAPAAIKAGTSTPVTVTLKDANGGPIANENVSFKLAGKGFYSWNSTDSAYTDVNGKYTFNLVTAAGDTGLSTVTFYNSNWHSNNSDYTAYHSTSKDIAVVAAVPTTKVVGKNLTVKYAYAAGKKVVLKVDGKVKYSGKPASNKLVSVTKALAKGNHTVVLTIGSLTVVNKVVSVK